MKNKFFLLLKAGLLYTFSTSKMGFGSKSRAKKIGIIILFAFLGIYLAAFSAVITVLFYGKVASAGLKMLIPSLFVSASAILNLLSALFTSAGFLFKAKDLPILFPLPVSHRTILAVKFTQFYLTEVLISLISLGVSMVTFYVLDGVTLMGLITGIIGIFIAPRLPMSIGVAIAFGVGMLIRNFKYKNQITTAITVISSVALVLAYYATSNLQGDFIIANAQALIDKVSSIYFPTKLFVNAFEGDVLSLLLFVAVNVLPLIILFLLVSLRYSSLVASFNTERTSSNYKYTAGGTSSTFGTFLSKEIKRVLSSSMYILNSCSSMLMLGMYAILSFKLKTLPDQLFGVSPELAEDILYLTMAGLIALACGFTSTSTSSISLEAKTLWILRSIPVDIKTIFNAKALTNAIIQLPVATVAVIVICIVLGFSIVKSLLLLALAAIVLLAASYGGLATNLLFPKLDWQNEMQVIKQSAAAGLYILFAFVVTTLFIGLAVLGMIFLHLDSLTLVLGVTALYMFLFLILHGVTLGWGVRKFQKIY